MRRTDLIGKCPLEFTVKAPDGGHVDGRACTHSHMDIGRTFMSWWCAESAAHVSLERK